MRKNVPVRTPRGIHDELAEAAEILGLSLAAYLEALVSDELVERLVLLSGIMLGSTCVNPRPPEAAAVRDLAGRYKKRQWEIWHELHRLYQKSFTGTPSTPLAS